MKIEELKNKYSSHITSTQPINRQKAKGYKELLSLYQKSSLQEKSEEVKLSIIAEEYSKKELNLYNITKVSEHKFKYIAAKECIIKYTSMDELSRLLNGLNTEKKDMATFINYMDGIGYMRKTKMADLISAWELANL